MPKYEDIKGQCVWREWVCLVFINHCHCRSDSRECHVVPELNASWCCNWISVWATLHVIKSCQWVQHQTLTMRQKVSVDTHVPCRVQGGQTWNLHSCHSWCHPPGPSCILRKEITTLTSRISHCIWNLKICFKPVLSYIPEDVISHCHMLYHFGFHTLKMTAESLLARTFLVDFLNFHNLSVVSGGHDLNQGVLVCTESLKRRMFGFI